MFKRGIPVIMKFLYVFLFILTLKWVTSAFALEVYHDNTFTDQEVTEYPVFERRFERIDTIRAVKSSFLYLLNKRDLIVVLDLDESLVHIKNLALLPWSSLKHWFDSKLHQALLHLGINDTEFGNMREVYMRISRLSWQQYEFVEEEIIDLIKSVQRHGGAVIVVTSDKLEYPDPRIAFLESKGINFSINLPHDIGPRVKQTTSPDKFNQIKKQYGIGSGVYSSYGTTKANIVNDLLVTYNNARVKTLDNNYKSLIIVDDHYNTIKAYRELLPKSMNTYIFEYTFFRKNVTTQHILNGIREIKLTVDKRKNTMYSQ